MKCFLFLQLFGLIVFVPIFSEAKIPAPQNTSDSSVVIYFKENINDFRKKNSSVLPEGKKVRLKDIQKSRKEIWALWRKANTDVAELPDFIKASEDPKYVYPTNTWQLHDEDPMPFYYISKGNQPKNGFPLFINIHGSGPKKSEFEATLRLALRYKDAPSLYFIPQIPNEKRYRWWFQPEQFAWEKLFRLSMLTDYIDANKLFFMGISEGGYGSQRLGAFYADYLAGAGPMAGGEPLENAPPLNYRNIAFSLQTGENDLRFGRNKLTQRAGEVFDSLKTIYPDAYNHKIEIQPGRGHSIDYTTTTPWLIQFKRNPHPSSVSWVNFPMHGRYRTGFYNIGIDKPLNISDTAEIDRAVFDLQMDKDKNTIHLDVWLTDAHQIKKEEVQQGEISIYLGPELINLSKKVKLYYRGKLIFNKKVSLNKRILIESCALFGDPERIFPGKITVNL
ncbi:MAG: hypothetical protein ABIN48_14730 [Ginsengibacter sp.]